MPIIKRPSPKTVPTAGGIGSAGASAAASAAQIGGVQLQGGKQLASFGASQISQGANAVSQGISFIGKGIAKATAAAQTGLYSDAMTRATIAFDDAVAKRTSRTKDDNGNPTFNTLTADVKEIGEGVKSEIGEGISDPEVKSQFERKFDGIVSNKQILSSKTARKQGLEFSRGAVVDGVDSSIKSAIKDDPTNVNQHIGHIQETVNSSVANGLLTEEEGKAIISNARDQVITGQYERLVDADPQSAKELLISTDAEQLGITADERSKFLKQAEAGIEDNKERFDLQQKENDSAEQAAKNSTANELDKGIDQGVVGKKEILRASQKGLINRTHKSSLVKKSNKMTKTALKKANLNAKINTAIKDNAPLIGFTSKQISDHYAQEVEAATPPGAQLTLSQKAGIAVKYRGAVSPIQKEISFGIVNGNEQEQQEALRAFEYLNDKQPMALQGMKKDSRLTAATALKFAENSSMSDSAAISLARTRILESKDDEVVNIRSKEFTKLDDFKDANYKETLQDELDVDEMSDEDAVVIRDMVRSAYMKNGDLEGAIAFVNSNTKHVFGNTEFNGSDEAMFLPPEKLFQERNLPKLREQLNDDVSAMSVKAGIAPSDVFIRSDADTRRPGAPISYALYHKDEFGNDIPLVDDSSGVDRVARWVPDEKSVLDNETKLEGIYSQTLRGAKGKLDDRGQRLIGSIEEHLSDEEPSKAVEELEQIIEDKEFRFHKLTDQEVSTLKQELETAKTALTPAKEEPGKDLDNVSETPGAPTRSTLGRISAKYESAGKGPGIVSSGRGDPGGKSYGTHQLASKTGTLQAYLRKSAFSDEFKGLRPGSRQFDRKWKELAKRDPEGFAADQHNFIKRTHFDPVRKHATKLGLPQGAGINEALFSMGVQHGASKRIVSNASKIVDFKSASESEIVHALFQARVNYVNGLSLSSSLKKSLRNRYRRELRDTLKVTK